MKTFSLIIVIFLIFCDPTHGQEILKNNSIDLRFKELGPALNQGQTNQCYAFASAVLLTNIFRHQISPQSLAFDYQFKNLSEDSSINNFLLNFNKNMGNPFELLNNLQVDNLCLEKEFPSSNLDNGVTHALKILRSKNENNEVTPIIHLKKTDRNIIKNFILKNLNGRKLLNNISLTEQTLYTNIKLDCNILDENESINDFDQDCIKNQANRVLKFIKHAPITDEIFLNYNYLETRAVGGLTKIPAGLYSKSRLLRKKINPDNGFIFRYNLLEEQNYFDTYGWIIGDEEATFNVNKTNYADLQDLMVMKKTLCSTKLNSGLQFNVHKEQDQNQSLKQINLLLSKGIPVLISAMKHAKVILGKKYSDGKLQWLIRDSQRSHFGDYYSLPKDEMIDFKYIIWIEPKN